MNPHGSGDQVPPADDPWKGCPAVKDVRRPTDGRSGSQSRFYGETDGDTVSCKDLTMSIVYLDSYLCPDSNESVIRIFGQTRDGQSALMHVFGYRPYIFFKAPDTDLKIKHLKARLSKILAKFEESTARLLACRGMDIYGYKTREEFFFKLELCRASSVKLVAKALLEQENVLPYESHVPYLLCFLSDYRLSGMSRISVRRFELISKNHERRQSSDRVHEVVVNCRDIVSQNESDCNMAIPSLQNWRTELNDMFDDSDVATASNSPSQNSRSHNLSSDSQNVDYLRQWITSGPSNEESTEADGLSEIPTSQTCVKWLGSRFGHETESSDSDGDFDVAKGFADIASNAKHTGSEHEEEIDDRHSKRGYVDQYDVNAVEKYEKRLKSSTPDFAHLEELRWSLSTQTQDSITRLSSFVVRSHPPSFQEVCEINPDHFIHQRPYFSNPRDVPGYNPNHESYIGKLGRSVRQGLLLTEWTPQEKPPILSQPSNLVYKRRKNTAQGFAVEKADVGSRNLEGLHFGNVRVLYLEVLGRSRKSLTPYAPDDPVVAIYALVCEDREEISSQFFFIDVDNFSDKEPEAFREQEIQLLHSFANYVLEYDPDILTGWDAQKGSLGYIMTRSERIGFEDFHRLLSRIPKSRNRPLDPRHRNDDFGFVEYTNMWIPGRHVLNMWRIVRHELSLSNYSIEEVVMDLFMVPLPRYSGGSLFSMFCKRSTRDRVCDHLLTVVSYIRDIALHLDIFTKTSEFAKLLGLDFFSTLTRGSQFRVESVLLRVGKGLNYVFPSPSVHQIASQPSLEVIALTLESAAGFYENPMAVLDFRSLYPSIIISSNLCFSTYVGKIILEDHPESGKVVPRLDFEAGGVFRLHRADRISGCYPSKREIRDLLDNGDLLVTSKGSVFVRKGHRPGVLGKMLSEILDTRFLIKQTIKTCKLRPSVEKNQVVARVLDARQLALKLLANVTYGYTAASFSGRMPMAGLADSIVLLGKQCLQRVIFAVGRGEIDGANDCPRLPIVRYGDTDSLFIEFPQCSVESSFRFARRIALCASSWFPHPMKLQFEKIYCPSLLVAKKRYCGLKFERVDGNGTLESKGIETVRRDSCRIMKSLFTTLLMTLFLTKDVSLVKRILLERLRAILEGIISVREFVFANKVRVPIRESYKNLPPGAALALRQSQLDPGSAPSHKERVAYVIVEGQGLLSERARSPSPSLNVDKRYYIERCLLRPLERLLGLVVVYRGNSSFNINVLSWYYDIRELRLRKLIGFDSKIPSLDITGRITGHFKIVQPCACCGSCSAGTTQVEDGLEQACSNRDPRRVAQVCQACMQLGYQEVWTMLSYKEREQSVFNEACRRQCLECSGDLDIGQLCINSACAVYYARDW